MWYYGKDEERRNSQNEKDYTGNRENTKLKMKTKKADSF